MTDEFQLLSNFPSRRFRLEELETLEEHARIEAIVHDDESVEVEGGIVRVKNCVFITPDAVHAVVYDEEEGSWQRVYHALRADAELTDAYESIREFRQNEVIFDRVPLSIEEAVFNTRRRSDPEYDEYSEGDEFECPVCGESHVVQKSTEEDLDVDTDFEDFSFEYHYVACPEARNEELLV